MAKNKTTENESSVTDFLNALPDLAKRNDSFRLINLLQNHTGYVPKLWGNSIIGFGTYHYKYASGHEGDAPVIGFSPRKEAISLYLYPDFESKAELLQNLGKHKAGKGCIYIKRLTDINEAVLLRMVSASQDFIQRQYPSPE
jgi:hypothetical protein